MNQQVSITEVIKAATQSMEADGISQTYINQLSHTWNALREYLSDKVGAVPFREIFVILRQAAGVRFPFAPVGSSGPFNDQLAFKAENLNNGCGGTNDDFFVQICFVYAIISIVKAYVEVA